MRKIFVLAAVLVVLSVSCTKEQRKSMLTKQETNIESFTKSILSKVDTAYVVQHRGVTRVVVAPGQGDSLETGLVSFYYAGYVLSSSSLSASNLFATNSEEVAGTSNWQLSGEDQFEILTLDIGNDDIVEGLRYGLEGVRAGQECYILFSGKYGFGKKPLGTIPANAALAYHVWVESIANE
ncbi:MAG: FKBP-type peptidyl-prolyl cis-trans isomerase [Candidatus Cryptobacteroides sp.]